jgi:hypothetical protein
MIDQSWEHDDAGRVILELMTERDRLREAQVWVSASTMEKDAPRWGEHFLIFRRGGERLGELAIQPDQIGLARYVPDDRTGWRLETNWQYGSKYALSQPTHWAKIPTPPKAEDT